jgi:hypothetical protein
VSVVIAGLLAVPFVSGGNSGTSGNSNTAHLYLYEKDSAWNVVEDGAWGKMTYRLSGPEFQYVFNGHHLMYDAVNPVDYSLIYYPDGWPGNGLIVLGSGVTVLEVCPDEYYVGLGYLHLGGIVNTGDMPASFDANYANGAKIWLVPTDDVDADEHMMVAWNPESYLFEGGLIKFVDTSAFDSLNMYEKNPVDWTVIDGGAHGLLTWDPDEDLFAFGFDGWGLRASTSFSLIYYPNPWEGTGEIVLGAGTTDADGYVHISSSIDTGDLPIADDYNADPSTTTYSDGTTGAKIWLVRSSDIVSGQMAGWNPTEYLFEERLIYFNDTNDW